MIDFSNTLIEWYKENARSLPWRFTKNPYKIWISEIILQQTQVKQGLQYYLSFIKTFPDISSLANAAEDKVLKAWQGLGYYSRARNLHFSAKMILSTYQGEFPKSYKDIIKLKGVGLYTAAAIASFAFDLPYPVVDGNVYRFLSRLKGIKTPIDTSEGKKQFYELAHQLLSLTDPAGHNQAMMEIGSLICKPKLPRCSECPFNTMCIAYQTNTIYDFPVKENKVKQRKRYFNYFLIQEKDGLYITKRTGNDIWKNLYELPLIESNQSVSAKCLKEELIPQKLNFESASIKLLHKTKHILSHQILETKFFLLIDSLENVKSHSDYIYIKQSDLQEYAFPQLLLNFFAAIGISKG